MTPTSDWTADQIAAWERVRVAGRTTFLIRTALRRGLAAGLAMLIVYVASAYLVGDWQLFPIWLIIWNIQTLLLGLLFVIGFIGIAYLGAAAQWRINEQRFQRAGGRHIQQR
jgi:hypothetical protein